MNGIIILIGINGFLGSITLYLTTSLFITVFSSSSFYTIFIITFIGILLNGNFYKISERDNWLTTIRRIFISTQICDITLTKYRKHEF